MSSHFAIPFWFLYSIVWRLSLRVTFGQLRLPLAAKKVVYGNKSAPYPEPIGLLLTSNYQLKPDSCTLIHSLPL